MPDVTVCPKPNGLPIDRKSTRLNSSHGYISYAVFCLKKKKKVTALVRQERGPHAVVQHTQPERGLARVNPGASAPAPPLPPARYSPVHLLDPADVPDA